MLHFLRILQFKNLRFLEFGKEDRKPFLLRRENIYRRENIHNSIYNNKKTNNEHFEESKEKSIEFSKMKNKLSINRASIAADRCLLSFFYLFTALCILFLLH